MDQSLKQYLQDLASRYEVATFIEGDPSWFMHQVEGEANREAMAFVASALSYGSRQQFMPRIEQLLDWACGDMHSWLLSGAFAEKLCADDTSSFYRLYNCRTMNLFLSDYGRLLATHSTMGNYLRTAGVTTGLQAVEAITAWFAKNNSGVVPRDAKSACKRVCMFLRWMVRSGSPVDLGLWHTFIDRRTLIMPLDTHVLQEACRLGLLTSRTATMSAALRLTEALFEVFPDDPLRGDFALFGYGVNNAL
ncbi:MAG: TIGR02757 family protein [Bacteroidales bacterium]|nr:TIGR02757 family protein [Bacteroidales bacterium]